MLDFLTSQEVEKAANKNRLLRPSMPNRVEGIEPNSLHEEKDPFFIAVTKAPEEKESFAA